MAEHTQDADTPVASCPLRGHLVVLEGLDRAGKSTQAERLVLNLQRLGRQVRHVRFPDRTTPIGQMIDAYLKGAATQEDHVIHLLFSANRWEAAAQIEADVIAGTDVVVDRYFYSGCVYSAAKQNPTLSLSWARKPEEGLPAPDVCIFLDISSEDAAKRGNFGEERYEKQEMQDRVRQLFYDMKDSKDGHSFSIVDAGQSINEVETIILQLVSRTVLTVDEQRLPLRHVEP